MSLREQKSNFRYVCFLREMLFAFVFVISDAELLEDAITALPVTVQPPDTPKNECNLPFVISYLLL